MPDLPKGIPFHFRKMYRHWEDSWDIALPFETIQSLNDSEFHIEIDTEFENKPMLMLEYVLEGKQDDIIHMASHLDHPGQCNDSLSGVISSLVVLNKLEKNTLSLGIVIHY